MARLNDRQYYSQFEGRVGIFAIGNQYNIGDIVEYQNVFYELMNTQILQAIATDAPGENANWAAFETPQLGDNRLLTLRELVDNYMVLYSDDDSYGGKIARTKVEALAKRAIQELSYDTLKVRSLEHTLLDIPTVPMPQDFVELVNIGWVNEQGIIQWLIQRKDSGNPRSAIQQEAVEANQPARAWSSTQTYDLGFVVGLRGKIYVSLIPNNNNDPSTLIGWAETTGPTYTYDDNGSIIYAQGTSLTLENFNSNQRTFGGSSVNNLSQYTTEGGFYTYGKRYYLDTETVNSHGTYFVNEIAGVIDVEPALVGQTLVMEYVSDGLSENPDEVFIPKFAEQAVYEAIYYEYIARKNNVPANEKERSKRRMFAKKREAKLRLSPISKRELLQTLRAQARWIKT